jgi:hypothetical protein
MASTNKTKNLKLSQFEAGDKPSFISDYSADMAKIDNAFTEVAPPIPIESELGLTATQLDRLYIDASGIVRCKPNV